MQHYSVSEKTQEHRIQVVAYATFYIFTLHMLFFLTINVLWKSVFCLLPEKENKIQGFLCLGKLGATTLRPMVPQWIYNKMKSDIFCKLCA